MNLFDIRTSTITSKGQIVIPVETRGKKGFESGTKVAILSFDDHLEIRPLKSVLDKMNFDAEVEKTGRILKEIVDKHGLRGKKIRCLTKADKDAIAKEILAKNR
ncbi:MAG: AbrB/MazE/SpoVT family DNA-binding domain-containing protein [Candidatus Diapherotrites archaeon]|nr:AbrB/MazE/SpoVT family DNA-binding domain-containing protein [Candidatus Diapherotrites archaeon]